MRVAFRRLLAVLLVAAGLLGGTGITAPTAGALGWGAIAISPTTGRVGYSQGLNSAIEAEQAAVGLCKARDCRAVVNFTKACGAVAQSIQNTSWGWGWDHSSTGAQNKALISCSQYGAGCRVAGWICS
jgi:ABC-type sugar transport system substrate-binding protein